MWADNETTQDLLGYKVHADLLKKIILNDSMLPISIGVFGNWGSGKSSLMLLLEEGIKQENNPNILQVKFNSWQFEDYDSTKLTMIETILETIAEDIASKKDVFEKIDELIAKINLLKAGLFILKKTYNNLVPTSIKEWLPSQADIDKITGYDKYKSLLENVKQGNMSRYIAVFHDLFEKLVENIGYKAVIVYVDDLDRCEPKRIIGCLEAVKLFVNVKHTAFVIGADERIIEYAIKQHYPLPLEKEAISSPFSDYLEKLIQLPYKLPRLSDNEQETYITLLLCKQNLNEHEFSDIHKRYLDFRARDKHSKYNIDNIRSTASKVNLSSVEYMLPIVPLMKRFLNGNPRQLKRFLNTLYVRLELARVAGFDCIKPEILVKLMVLEYNTLFSQRFEDLYRRQRDNNGILDIKGVESEAKSGNGIKNPFWKNDWNSEYLIQWLASKPSLKNINLQNYFWVARDALKKETPIASLVTNKINVVFKQLCAIQTDSVMKKQLPSVLQSVDEDEKTMLILLLNDRLRFDVQSDECWRILRSDENNLLIGNSIEKLKRLMDNLNPSEIPPSSDNFFVRMLQIEGEIHDYVENMPKSNQLKNSIKRLSKSK